MRSAWSRAFGLVTWRMALMAVRKGGRVSIPGVYGGLADKFPLGALMEKGLQIRTGQTHVQKYTQELLRRILEGEIDTTFLISHRLSLEDAPTGYRNFHGRQDEWTKVVMTPGTAPAQKGGANG